MSNSLSSLSFYSLAIYTKPYWKIVLVSKTLFVHSLILSPACLSSHMSEKSNSYTSRPADLRRNTGEVSPDKRCKDWSLSVLGSKSSNAEMPKVLGNSN